MDQPKNRCLICTTLTVLSNRVWCSASFGGTRVFAVAMQCDPRTFHLTEVDSVHIDTFVQHFDDAMEKVRLQRVCRV